jgi:hypothetical protein
VSIQQCLKLGTLTARPLPNDLIHDVSVTPIPSPGEGYLFELSIRSANEIGETTEVMIRIEVREVHVEDPTSRP